MLYLLAQDIFDAATMKGMVQQCPWAVAACVIVWLVLRSKKEDKRAEQTAKNTDQKAQIAQAEMCHSFQREMHVMTSAAMKAMADAMLATAKAYGENTQALRTNGECMKETTEMLRETARILRDR